MDSDGIRAGAVEDVAPDRRFAGLDRLYGTRAAASVRRSHVVVVGLGGVGSWSVESLVRSGVSRLTLIDLDHISESNVNRQVHALESTLGLAKVHAMRDRIEAINRQCDVLAIEDFVDADNWPGLLAQAQGRSGPVDAVIDACDEVRAKVAMSAWARNGDAVFVTVGAAGGKRLAHRVDVDDLSRVTHDPLLSGLRYRLRKSHAAPREARKIGIDCVFSREAVARPDVCTDAAGAMDGSLNCHGYGSIATVTATFGHCAAGWIIDRLAGRATL